MPKSKLEYFQAYLHEQFSEILNGRQIDAIAIHADEVFLQNMGDPEKIDHPRLNEEELMALTALVNGETCERDATNSGREANGMAMAYDDTIPWPALDALRAELKRRKVLQ